MALVLCWKAKDVCEREVMGDLVRTAVKILRNGRRFLIVSKIRFRTLLFYDSKVKRIKEKAEAT
jgi:hypothetical protein